MIQKKWLLATTAAILGGVIGIGATAQELGRGQSVDDRTKPENAPLGIRAGSFVISPELSLSETFDDNIFATDDGTVSDFITKISPVLNIKSDWNRHELKFNTGGDFGFFADNDRENFQDYFAKVSGRFDIVRDTYLTSNLSFNHDHEDRGSPDTNAATESEPTEYDTYKARLGGSHTWNRLKLDTDGGVTMLRFDDVKLFSGAERDKSFRDRNVYDIKARATYELLPTVKPFVEYQHNWRAYQSDTSASLRDSNGFVANVGTTLDLGGVVVGDIYAGVIHQSYSNSAFDDLTAANLGASLTWNPTQLTSVNLSLSRTVEETTLSETSSGYVASGGSVRVDHELTRSISLHASAGYFFNDYDSINREEDVFDAGVGASYALNRNFSVEADYSYKHRDVNISGQDYSRNKAMLRLVGKL